MVFNATFNNFSYIVAVSFIGGRNWSTQIKTIDLPQVTTFALLTNEQLSHTIYAAKFEQTIIHQHVHL
jgi:hypothetical protein